MTPDLISVITLAIALTLHLAIVIQETRASKGSIGKFCESYQDCQAEKGLTCSKHRNTCDCAFKPSTFSAVHQKCLMHVGAQCTLPGVDRQPGPLPDLDCVENAKCVHKPDSRAFNHGVCECLHGYYRTAESYCFKLPDPSSSSSSNSNSNKYPSLSNVLNSIPSSSESKPGGHHHHSDSNSDKNVAPPAYHNSLIRSSAPAAGAMSSQFTIIASLVIFAFAFVLSS